MSETPKSKRSNRKPTKAATKKPVKAKDYKSTKVSESKLEGASNNKAEVTSDDKQISSEGFSLRWLAIALFALGAAVLIYAMGFKSNDVTTSEPKSENTKSGTTASIGGPFRLVDQEGITVTDIDFRGQYLLIYFGYTYCPDVCPTSLTDITDTLTLLGDGAAKVTPILITIDPKRDTSEQLKEYASFFHPRLRALTGTPEQIAAVAKAYRVYFNKAKQENATSDDYLMDHSSAIYLMGPDGTFLSHFSYGTDAKTMAQRIRDILS